MKRSKGRTPKRTRGYVTIGEKRVPLRRARVFFFIASYKKNNDGNNPTYQEIADHFCYSVNTAYVHVLGLVTFDKLLRFTERRRFDLNGKYEPPAIVGNDESEAFDGLTTDQ